MLMIYYLTTAVTAQEQKQRKGGHGHHSPYDCAVRKKYSRRNNTCFIFRSLLKTDVRHSHDWRL